MNEPGRTPAEAALQRSRNLPIALLFLGTIINYVTVTQSLFSIVSPKLQIGASEVLNVFRRLCKSLVGLISS